MAIEKIDEIRLPYEEESILSGDPQRLNEYIKKLLMVLQQINEKYNLLLNLLIDLSSGEWVYFGTKNAIGEYPDGTWRRGVIGNNLIEQVRIDSDWTTVHTRERPIV